MACNCENQGNTYHLNMGCCVPIVANANNYFTKSETIELIDAAIIESGCCIDSGDVETMIETYTYDKETIDDKVGSGCCITPEEVDEKIDAAISGIDLSDYALKSEIPTVPTSNSAFTNDRYW